MPQEFTMPELLPEAEHFRLQQDDTEVDPEAELVPVECAEGEECIVEEVPAGPTNEGYCSDPTDSECGFWHDTAAIPIDEPWYCDPELESSDEGCPQPNCDPNLSDCSANPPRCYCDLDSEGERPEFCDKCPDPDVENNNLPPWLRNVAQILAAIFEFHVVFLAIFPWWVLGIGLILGDLIWDWFWYLIFFAFCKPCAYVFVWILNIPQMFIHVMYWYQRLQLELVGFIFDGWMLFIGGDGCFLRWGEDCWFARRISERDHMTYTDIVWLTIKQPATYKGTVWLDQATSS